MTRGRVRAVVVSYSAQFKQQTSVIRGLAEAMEEAIDQRERDVRRPSRNAESQTRTAGQACLHGKVPRDAVGEG